jgi:hypothetical protein
VPITVAAQSPDGSGDAGQHASLGAVTMLEADVFGGDRSLTSLSGSGSVMLRDGKLELSPSDPGRPLTHRHSLDGARDVVRVEADVELGSRSRAGLMCESEALDRTFSVGLLFTSGVLIGRFGSDGWVEGARAPHGQPFWPDAHLAVECAVTPDGGEHVAIWLDGALALEHVFEETIGPFGSISLSAETVEPPEPMTFVGVDISAGDIYEPADEGGQPRIALEDGFDDESLWEPLDDGQRRIGHSEGSLQASVSEAGLSVWTWRTIDLPSPSMTVSTDLVLMSAGVAGLMCGSDDTGSFFVGVVLLGGQTAVGKLIDGEVEILEFLALPAGTDLSEGVPVRLDLECLARGGGERVALSVDGTLVASTWLDEPSGGFDAAGVFGEASDGPSDARFDDLVVVTSPS